MKKLVLIALLAVSFIANNIELAQASSGPHQDNGIDVGYDFP